MNHFVAFALSFTTLILLWAVHNGFFRRYEMEDTGDGLRVVRYREDLSGPPLPPLPGQATRGG